MIGEYHYREARFTVERRGRWLYCVDEVKLPWQEGTLICLAYEAGWFGLTARSVIRKVRRTVDREFRRREWNGGPTHRGADAEGLSFDPLPIPALPAREVA